MIGTLLQFVVRQLNQAICDRLQIDASNRRVVLVSHVLPDGTFCGQEDNALLVCVAGVRQDIVPRRPTAVPNVEVPGPGGGTLPAFPHRPASLHLNVHILLAANFQGDQVQSGLDQLAFAIGWLQRSPIWDRRRFPGMPPGVTEVVFEMENLGCQDQSHLWDSIGATYRPSVVYKLRMAIPDDQDAEALIPDIQSHSPTADL